MRKTNFDRYLQEQMKSPAFAARFERAGEAWDVAMQTEVAPRAAAHAKGLDDDALVETRTNRPHSAKLTIES